MTEAQLKALVDRWRMGDRLVADEVLLHLWELYPVVQRRLVFKLQISVGTSVKGQDGQEGDGAERSLGEIRSKEHHDEPEDNLSMEEEDGRRIGTCDGQGRQRDSSYSQTHDILVWGFDAMLEELDLMLSQGAVYMRPERDSDSGGWRKVGAFTDRQLGDRRVFQWKNGVAFYAFVKTLWEWRSIEAFRKETHYTGPERLRNKELSDPVALVKRILESQDPLCRFLRGELGQDLLKRWSMGGEFTSDLVKGLNKIITKKSIWTRERFPNLDIHPASTKNEIARQNIQLLETAFPGLIVLKGLDKSDGKKGTVPPDGERVVAIKDALRKQDKALLTLIGRLKVGNQRHLCYLLQCYFRVVIWNACPGRKPWTWLPDEEITDAQEQAVCRIIDSPIEGLLAEVCVNNICLDPREARDFIQLFTLKRLKNSDPTVIIDSGRCRNTYLDTPISRLKGDLREAAPWFVSERDGGTNDEC